MNKPQRSPMTLIGAHIEYKKQLGKKIIDMSKEEQREYQRLGVLSSLARNGKLPLSTRRGRPARDENAPQLQFLKETGKRYKELTPKELNEYNRLRMQHATGGRGVPARKNKDYVAYATRISRPLNDRVNNALAALRVPLHTDKIDFTEHALELYVKAMEQWHNNGQPFPPAKKD